MAISFAFKLFGITSAHDIEGSDWAGTRAATYSPDERITFLRRRTAGARARTRAICHIRLWSGIEERWIGVSRGDVVLLRASGAPTAGAGPLRHASASLAAGPINRARRARRGPGGVARSHTSAGTEL